jgi:glycerate 2-kinase
VNDAAADRRVERAFVLAVERFDLSARVERTLPRLPPPRAGVRVLAVGKAAPAMVRGAFRAWSARIERSLVVVPDGTACDLEDARVEVVRAGHPLPDARSVDAAERGLSLAAQGPRDVLVVLVSGGASALFALPIEGVTLEDKVSVTRALLASGASIEETNLVRRHLSRVKGGGLTRAAAPGRVLALLASDVIGGHVYDIGSGPTTTDPTTVSDARAALTRWAPSFARLPLRETLDAGELAAKRQRVKIVASPNDLAEAVALLLAEEGFAARVLPPSNVDAVELAAAYEAMCDELGPGSAVVRAAEPRLAVTATRPGKGGRASHIAALVGRRLREGFVFLAGASDGVDGTSGAGGAVVDASLRRIGDRRIEEALAGFDTASIHEEAGTVIRIGPSGMNFTDIHILCRLG